MQKLVFGLFAVFSFLFPTKTDAQRYKTAAGVRLGSGIGLTVQQYLTDGWTAEGIVQLNALKQDFGLTALGEKHHKIIARGLNFYYGGGAHQYFVKDKTAEDNYGGVSGIVGAELSVGKICFAFDWKPEIRLWGDLETHSKFDAGAAFSVRYILAKREREKLIDRDKLKFKKKSDKKSDSKKKKSSGGGIFKKS